jgi:hypothetical protein
LFAAFHNAGILDIEYPHLGLVKSDAFDQSIIELRKSLNN